MGHILGSADMHACQQMVRYLDLRPAARRGILDLLHISNEKISGHDVHQQNCLQLLLVLRLEQVVEGARRQSRKRLVGRGKHRERSLSLQRFGKSGRFERLHKRLEVTGRGNTRHAC